VLPGSHRWSETDFPGALKDQDFATEEDVTDDLGAHPDAESHHARGVFDDCPGRSVASGWGEPVGYRALSYHAAILCGVAATSGKYAVVGSAGACRYASGAGQGITGVLHSSAIYWVF